MSAGARAGAAQDASGHHPNAGAGRRLLMIEQGGRGGVADYAAQLTHALAERGWSVTLATADDHRYSPSAGVTIEPVFHYVRDDTELGRKLRARGLGRVANGVCFLLALPRLTRLAARADIVHTHGSENPQLGLLAILCLRLTGTPVVQTLHNTFERSTTFVRTRKLVRRLTVRLTVRTIVHAQADLAVLTPEVRAQAVVIPHGEYGGLARTGGSVERPAARAALGIPAQALVTLLFGQLRLDKGIGDLLQAARLVPDLHVLIGGQDAGGLAAVRPLLDDPELHDRITLREGFLEMSEAAQLFAAADTVALPYRAASQSGVLLLAYGFARPVVVYPSGGLPESVIDGQTGWVCSAAESPALARALADAVAAGAAECLRRGEAGRELAHERFAWPVIARRTSELYEEVLAQGER
jgi:glycosyltransferase involved in cell wall biosynthesis